MKKILALAAALFLSSQAYAFKAGEWEFTTQTSIQNMSQLPPGMGMHSYTFRNCITERDAVPQRQNGEQKCKMTKMVRRGDTVNWEISCDTPNGETKGVGSATYSGDTMRSTMHFTGGPMDMTQEMTGHYVGPCSN
ncbi:MAG TPA: DUF3617 domain-containing protein [Burkholderiales bacterium]|nr:DUF3617 domain-containing protein [Burkholderiales bacterium]